jgi:hypothetical protein
VKFDISTVASRHFDVPPQNRPEEEKRDQPELSNIFFARAALKVTSESVDDLEKKTGFDFENVMLKTGQPNYL